MRWLIVLAILCPPLSVFAQEATVQIGSLQITRGILEADVRLAFPSVKCWSISHRPGKRIEDCYVGDGVPPESDGFVSFIDGRVQMATRYWHLPKESGPYEVLRFVNNILDRLTSEAGVCAEIAPPVYMERRPNVTSTMIYFPEKFLLILTNKPGDKLPGEFYIHEGLRDSPVPPSSEVEQNVDPTKRCALVE